MIGGDVGEKMASAGGMVSNMGTAASTGDYGGVIGAAAQGATQFTTNDANDAMISGLGNSASGVLNNAVDGNGMGALNSLGSGLAYIPGEGGEKAQGALNTTTNVMEHAMNGNTQGAITAAGQGVGNMLPGEAGQVVQNLTPTAASVYSHIDDKNYGQAVTTGLQGISPVIPHAGT